MPFNFKKLYKQFKKYKGGEIIKELLIKPLTPTSMLSNKKKKKDD